MGTRVLVPLMLRISRLCFTGQGQGWKAAQTAQHLLSDSGAQRRLSDTHFLAPCLTESRDETGMF
jgi:hypothetical protein